MADVLPISLNSANNEPRALKRRKVVDHTDKHKFAPGAILKVKVRNFVVYASTEFLLSPSLNMIIAPNGTGKSTFVCAVCLGLAGAVTLLGRQKTLAGFIKNGEDSSMIEITLKNHNEEKDVVITREFYPNNKSDWFINHKPVSETKVKTLLQSLNVQLDNLCQFLPQEKVASFAALDQKRLLLETQRAVDIKLMEQHTSLNTLEVEKLEVTAKLIEAQKEKAGIEVEKERFEEEAKKYAAHKKKQAEIDDHVKLVPFARMEDLTKQQEALKAQRDEIKRQLEAYAIDMEPFEEAQSQAEAAVGETSSILHDHSTKWDDLQSKLEKDEHDVEVSEQNIRKLKADNARLKEKVEKDKVELKKTTALLTEQRQRLSTLEVVDENAIKEYAESSSRLFDELQDYKGQIQDLEGDIDKCKRSIHHAKTQAENAKRELSSNDKVHIFQSENLQRSRPAQETKKAVHLLRTELKDLRNEIFQPPILTISTAQPRYSDYLENLVPFQTSLSITAISKAAYDKCSPEFIEKRNVNPSFRYLSNRPMQGGMSQEQLQQLGFDGYLKDFIQGPQPVVQMLCEIAFIHDVPVAIDPLNDRQIETLRQPYNGKLLFKKFFSGDTLYTLSQSQYGSRQITMRSSQVKRAVLYTDGGVSESMKRNYQEQIKNASNLIEKSEEQIRSIRDQIDQITEQRNGLKVDFNDYRKLESELKSKKAERTGCIARIESLENRRAALEEKSGRDYSNEIIKNKQRMGKFSMLRMNLLCSVAKHQVAINALARDIISAEILKLEADNRHKSLRKLFESFTEQKRTLERQYKEARERIQKAKNSPERIALKEEVSNYDQDTRLRLTELINQYRDEQVFSEEGVHGILDSLRAELKLLGSGSKSSVASLERLTARLAELDRDIPEYTGQVAKYTSEMTKIHDDWEPKLMDKVRKISSKFSHIFPTVGSAGEIRVAKAERFSDWRMEIMVKFRDESDLQPLDSQTQSGGERAVSTVYYMISMQELTSSPFRVVDEINQGMDARNERIVHKHMVEVACQEHTSQYFLITPKLLTNLHYADNMRVHCIMAGPWTPDPRKNPEMLSLGATAMYE